jgi:hypothetical protein
MSVQVHRGITRTVLVTGRWAVKFPSFRAYGHGLRGVLWSVTRGIQANLSELAWSDSPGVCPVRWSLAGLVNVYPRADRVPDGAHIDWDAIGFLGPADRKEPNVGRLAGRLVMIDYDMSWADCLCRRGSCNTLPGLGDIPND